MATLDNILSSNRPASPVLGEAYYETDTNKIIAWNGAFWTEVVSDGALSSFSNAYSLSLDGTNDYATISSTFSALSGNKSITGWFRFNDTNQNAVFGNTTGQYSCLFWTSSTIFFSTSAGSVSISLSTTLTTGTWYHIAFTGNGTDLKCYINGTQEGGTKTDGDWSIGEFFRGGTSFYFDGDVDEIGLWTGTELSASDVLAIANLGEASGDKAVDLSTYTGLTHWWRFGDGDTSPTVSDNVGSNDMTLINGPTFSSDVPS